MLNVNVDQTVVTLWRQLLHCSFTRTVPQTVCWKGNSDVWGSRSHIFTLYKPGGRPDLLHICTPHILKVCSTHILLCSLGSCLLVICSMLHKMNTNKSMMICSSEIDFKPSVILYNQNHTRLRSEKVWKNEYGYCFVQKWIKKSKCFLVAAVKK